MNLAAVSGIPLSSLRAPLRATLLVLGTIGVASPFLPFAYSTSPLEVIVKAGDFLVSPLIVLLAMPFFLAPLALVVSLRVLVLDRFTVADALVAWISSVAMTAATLCATVWPIVSRAALQAGDWVVIAVGWIAIAAGIGLLRHCVRRGLPPAGITLISMQCAYIANAVFCLGVFWSDWQVGAFVSATAVAAFAAHIAMLVAYAVPGGDRSLRGGSR